MKNPYSINIMGAYLKEGTWVEILDGEEMQGKIVQVRKGAKVKYKVKVSPDKYILVNPSNAREASREMISRRESIDVE